jgi:hypothetical protein
MTIVFEPELWGVSPLVPYGKTPTFKRASTPADGGTASAGSPAKTPAKTSGGLKLWDGGSFDFHDILDVINPLQHLPIVSSIYRSEVKDEIGAVPRILGSMLYGGGVVGALIGAASAIVNVVVEHETGKDLGQHIYTAIFGEGAGTRRTTQVAAPKTGEAAAAAAKKKAAETKPAEAAAPAAHTAAAANMAAAAPGAKRLSSKADAALQAFVAGLAKNASPAAAAAAQAATTKRSLRVVGAANAAAAANGKTAAGAPTKGEIATQFRRTDWYQRNQAILKAQAAALAKNRAAAGGTHPAKSGTGQTTSGAAILQLFMNPSLVPGKPSATTPGGTATGKPTAITPAANTPPAKPTAAKPAAAQRGAVAGPWVANEIASGLSKYEALVKSRAAAAGK